MEPVFSPQPSATILSNTQTPGKPITGCRAADAKPSITLSDCVTIGRCGLSYTELLHFTAPPVIPEMIFFCATAKMISKGRLIKIM